MGNNKQVKERFGDTTTVSIRKQDSKDPKQ